MPDLLKQINAKLHTLNSQSYPNGELCLCDAKRKYTCSICAEYTLLAKCQAEIISLRKRLRALEGETQ